MKEIGPLQTHMLISAVGYICHKLNGVQIFLTADLIWCVIVCHADEQDHWH